MALTLGAAPEQLTVILVRDADFVQQLSRKDDTPWPVGAALTIEFTKADGTKTTWQATFSNQTAVWNVDAAEVNTLIAARPRSAKLWYVQGELKLLWADGEPDIR